MTIVVNPDFVRSRQVRHDTQRGAIGFDTRHSLRFRLRVRCWRDGKACQRGTQTAFGRSLACRSRGCRQCTVKMQIVDPATLPFGPFGFLRLRRWKSKEGKSHALTRAVTSRASGHLVMSCKYLGVSKKRPASKRLSLAPCACEKTLAVYPWPM